MTVIIIAWKRSGYSTMKLRFIIVCVDSLIDDCPTSARDMLQSLRMCFSKIKHVSTREISVINREGL